MLSVAQYQNPISHQRLGKCINSPKSYALELYNFCANLGWGTTYCFTFDLTFFYIICNILTTVHSSFQERTSLQPGRF